jgi:hypothetical protein
MLLAQINITQQHAFKCNFRTENKYHAGVIFFDNIEHRDSDYAAARFIVFAKTHSAELNRSLSEFVLANSLQEVVPAAGLEPARSHDREILSLLRLPLRHAG